MTDTLLDPNDTGEIKRIPGEARTVVIRTDVGETLTRLHVPTIDDAKRERLVGEATQNIKPYTAEMRPFRLDDATGEIPRFVEPALGLSGADLRPAAPNPGPLPPTPVEPNPNPPAPRPSVPPSAARWELIADTDRVSLLQAINPDGERPERYVGRHRDPQNRRAVPGRRQFEVLIDAAVPVPGPRRYRLVLLVGACFVVWAATVVISLRAWS